MPWKLVRQFLPWISSVLELDLPESVLVVLVQVSQGDLEDTALEAIGGELGALGAVHQGLAGLAVGEEGGGLDIVPVLAGVGINAGYFLKIKIK